MLLLDHRRAARRQPPAATARAKYRRTVFTSTPGCETSALGQPGKPVQAAQVQRDMAIQHIVRCGPCSPPTAPERPGLCRQRGPAASRPACAGGNVDIRVREVSPDGRRVCGATRRTAGGAGRARRRSAQRGAVFALGRRPGPGLQLPDRPRHRPAPESKHVRIANISTHCTLTRSRRQSPAALPFGLHGIGEVTVWVGGAALSWMFGLHQGDCGVQRPQMSRSPPT
jgi:hypothetical protein